MWTKEPFKRTSDQDGIAETEGKMKTTNFHTNDHRINLLYWVFLIRTNVHLKRGLYFALGSVIVKDGVQTGLRRIQSSTSRRPEYKLISVDIGQVVLVETLKLQA